MFVDEIIARLDELKEEGRVKDWDYFEDEKEAYGDGFIWVDEIDKWVKLD